MHGVLTRRSHAWGFDEVCAAGDQGINIQSRRPCLLCSAWHFHRLSPIYNGRDVVQ